MHFSSEKLLQLYRSSHANKVECEKSNRSDDYRYVAEFSNFRLTLDVDSTQGLAHGKWEEDLDHDGVVEYTGFNSLALLDEREITIQKGIYKGVYLCDAWEDVDWKGILVFVSKDPITIPGAKPNETGFIVTSGDKSGAVMFDENATLATRTEL